MEGRLLKRVKLAAFRASPAKIKGSGKKPDPFSDISVKAINSLE